MLLANGCFASSYSAQFQQPDWDRASSVYILQIYTATMKALDFYFLWPLSWPEDYLWRGQQDAGDKDIHN